LRVVEIDETRPPAERTSRDLWAKADELHRMASTATTRDTRDALLRLAARYGRLATTWRAADHMARRGKHGERDSRAR
jgi:hypothetical protein